jgi:hypothetical protein
MVINYYNLKKSYQQNDVFKVHSLFKKLNKKMFESSVVKELLDGSASQSELIRFVAISMFKNRKILS